MALHKISKNCFKGEVITNPGDIIKLVKQRKSVYSVRWGLKPATFIASMQFRMIMYAIEHKQLYFVLK